MYLAALHQSSTQAVDSAEVFEKLILPKQPQIISKIKKRDENTVNDLEQVCP